MTFHVGQKVVCVDASPSSRASRAPLVQDAVYTITGIFGAEDGDGLALSLLEIVNEGRDWFGYNPARFRPAVERKTDISIFTAMLTPQGVDA